MLLDISASKIYAGTMSRGSITHNIEIDNTSVSPSIKLNTDTMSIETYSGLTSTSLTASINATGKLELSCGNNNNALLQLIYNNSKYKINAQAEEINLTATGQNSILNIAGTTINATCTNFIATGNVRAQSFYATSDKRLKENIVEYKPEKSILDLPVYKFDFINGAKNNIGCLAQDLKEICPEIVSENDNGYLSINESKIVYLLLDEVKKLKKEVEELKK